MPAVAVDAQERAGLPSLAFGYGGYRRLVGDFGRSPVTRAGSAGQFTGGIAIGLRF